MCSFFGHVFIQESETTPARSPGEFFTHHPLLHMQGVPITIKDMRDLSLDGVTPTAVTPDPDREQRPIRVVIIDDHPAIRQALDDTVGTQADMEMCGKASSARDGLHMVREEEPDVVVTDIALGDAHGLEVVEHIHEHLEDTKVVVFSVYQESAYAERAIHAGALSYVMKSAPTDELVAAIRNVDRGEVHVSRRMAGQLLGKLVRQRRDRLDVAIDELTPRERTVFELLGDGFSMRGIIESLGLDRKTVETYRRRAREKLGFKDNEAMLQSAVRWMCHQNHTLDLSSENGL